MARPIVQRLLLLAASLWPMTAPMTALAAPEPAAAPAPAVVNLPAPVPAPACPQAPCVVKLTPAQLLAAAERLVVAGRYDEARSLLSALTMAPGFTLQTRFLTGYMAQQQGDYVGAARAYKAILADDPSQTRVRLELGRTMIAMGQSAAADRQLRLAQQSRELDPDLARLVRGARDVIRSSRAFRADLSVGIAPDSNINNATSARKVDVNLGGYTLPLTLNPDARAKSGTGLAATGSLATRLPIGADLFFIGNADTNILKYDGSRFDDYLVQIAAGADLQLSDATSVSLQPIAAQRWYGGRVASRQIGARGGIQTALDATRRVGVQVDLRHTDTSFDRAFDGFQGGVYASYESGLGRNFFASAQGFVRRDGLNAASYSNVEVGLGGNIAGELPHGINIGFGGSASHAWFDAAIPIFSDKPRQDWRVTSQVSLGYRKIRVFGFSPQVTWQATAIRSSLDIYRVTRSRFSFSLARYF